MSVTMCQPLVEFPPKRSAFELDTEMRDRISYTHLIIGPHRREEVTEDVDDAGCPLPVFHDKCGTSDVQSDAEQAQDSFESFIPVLIIQMCGNHR